MSATAYVLCQPDPAWGEPERLLEALRRLSPGARLHLIEGEGPAAAPPAEGIVRTRLPLRPQDRWHGEFAGMQLALNEGAGTVVLLPGRRLLPPSLLARALGLLAAGAADAALDRPRPGAHADFAAVTARAAWLAGLWSQLPPLSPAKRAMLLTWLPREIGARVRWLEAEGDPPADFAEQTFGPEEVEEVFRHTSVPLAGVRETPAAPVASLAVVTPYHREATWKLRRCHESVLRQRGGTIRHVMVADGHPDPEAAGWDCTHIALHAAHADNGNTPRGIGGVLAFAQGFDAVTYLDADNWFADGHLEAMLETQRQRRAAVVCGTRRIVLLDGTEVPGADAEDAARLHVDTSCLLITRNRLFLAACWAMMPRWLGPVCDRIAFSRIARFGGIAWCDRQSVYFESNYRAHYALAGRAAPEKPHDMDLAYAERLEAPDEATRADYTARTGRPFPKITGFVEAARTAGGRAAPR